MSSSAIESRTSVRARVRTHTKLTSLTRAIGRALVWGTLAVSFWACSAAPAWSQPCNALSLQGGYAAASGAVFPIFGWESFTVEAWILPHFDGMPPDSTPTFFDMVIAANSTYTLAFRNDGFLPSRVEATIYGLTDTLFNETPVVWGQWNHVALVYERPAFGQHRAGVFVNGVGTMSVIPFLNVFPPNTPFTVGAFKLSTDPPERFFYGYIDELHVSAGARYVSNFTPPLTPQRDDATRGLYHFDGTGAKTFRSDAPTFYARDLIASGHAVGGRAPICGTGAPTIDDWSSGSWYICDGKTGAFLSVYVTATGPPSYQWYRGTSGDTLSPIAGATENTYSTTQGGNYWVRIQNMYGHVDSPTATVTVEACPPPTVVTLPATNATQTTATLNGTGNPNGNGNYTISSFQYGLTTQYGSSVEATPYYYSGTVPVPVTASISGLTCGTTYHVRAFATNIGGSAQGTDLTFTTAACPAPVVQTLAAAGVTATGATLHGTVNPNGAVTTAVFQYGVTTNYGLTITASPTPGSGTSPVPVSAAVVGLTCNILYHFRLTAANGAPGAGSDLTFTTGRCNGFTDDPLILQSTALKAVHLSELRVRIDSLRARFSLTAFVWTDPTLDGVPARSTHVQQLRDALRAAYAAAIAGGRPVTQPSFADEPLTPGTAIRAVHIEQLRAAVLVLEGT